MPTVRHILDRLFPQGTNTRPSGETTELTTLPAWPPDVFAAAATLADLSGCYSRPLFSFSPPEDPFFSAERLEKVREVGQAWAGSFTGLVGAEVDAESKARARKAIAWLREHWKALLGAGECDVSDTDAAAQAWWKAAMTLLVTADVASAGVGFLPGTLGKYPLVEFVCRQHGLYLERQEILLKMPYSLCWMVPPGEVCVQPKSRTPQAGCTLRSFSHHLALLPSRGEVVTTWSFIPAPPARAPAGLELENRPFNLLVVPFPFHVDRRCFSPGDRFFASASALPRDPDKQRWRFFGMQQDWLRHNGRDLTGGEVSRFLLDLVDRAKKEFDEVHGVILPEFALNQPIKDEVSENLAKESQLELFITGYAATDDKDLPKNMVHGRLYVREADRPPMPAWEQSKHHRWMLERGQIDRYRIGDRLHPDFLWWEQINIEGRQCGFWVFRRISSLVTLVCEDLARIDPVQKVIRSIGPTLVVALLMDGPQRTDRWSARYATVLAEDPGSAVLTLTSLGLIRRAEKPDDKAPREIGLWRGAEPQPRPLLLPRDHHALLLTLSATGRTNFSLDGRSDEGTTVGLLLSEMHPIRHDGPPHWAKVD